MGHECSPVQTATGAPLQWPRPVTAVTPYVTHSPSTRLPSHGRGRRSWPATCFSTLLSVPPSTAMRQISAADFSAPRCCPAMELYASSRCSIQGEGSNEYSRPVQNPVQLPPRSRVQACCSGVGGFWNQQFASSGLFRNQQVAGSIPAGGSSKPLVFLSCNLNAWLRRRGAIEYLWLSGTTAFFGQSQSQPQ